MAYFLAIDLGTSGPKAAVVDSDGAILGHAFAPTQLVLLPDGGAEQSPTDWWQAIVRVSRQAIFNANVAPSAITHISATAQWSGTVSIGFDGKPLGNAIIWMDTRGQKTTVELCGGFPEVDGYNVFRALSWMRITGGGPSLSGKDSLSHVLYLQHERPDVYTRTQTFLEPKDFINYKLTGERVGTFDSMHLHWVSDARDPTGIRYSDTLLKRTGLETEKLPPMVKATDIVGTLNAEAAEDLGLARDVKVIGGTPDIHSAILGSGASRDFACHVYIGTSSWLTTHVPFKKTDITANMGSIPAALPGRYVLGTSQETAGACLEVLKRVTNAASYDAMLSAAASSPAGARKLLFIPWLVGERSPLADGRLRGGFSNMSLDVTHGDMVRAVLEGVAYNGRWLQEHVEKFIGRRTGTLNMIGGGARSELWCSIYADVLQRPVRQMLDPHHANARGAGLLAAVASGAISADAIDERVPVAKTFEPQAERRALYDDLYGAFREACTSARTLSHRLARSKT